MNNVVFDGPENGPLFLFAHGAGAGMDHEFMQDVTTRLAEKGVRVARFNFPYMEKRAVDGKKRPPDRAPKLLEAMTAVIEDVANGQPIVIGGKSMGGRMASMLSENPMVQSIACLGFPFHPPGKPENYKGAHLATIDKPILIIQGERDTFGKFEEFERFEFSDQVSTSFIPDGDHSFKPRKSSGFTEAQNRQLAVDRLALFIKGISDV
ncbi:alpha/beta family hydrolase [Vibrio barjaei]|jgi:predicted alpha/beta-hydrolase family hydrolase|uniref:Alpha/beta family hydrolase n=1 Tax=Vibrio barjaei TaxID=1676683 RepID=A0ABW7IKN5_9VIBR|nr:alpha/beta family hydrolase [Vibrio barjaei]MCY9869455.1 dienelactone hydrolase family protein [Vibrio barjaei]